MNQTSKFKFGIVMFLLIVSIVTADLISTNKERYDDNEVVTISTDTQNLTNAHLKLISRDKTYNYLDPPTKIRFLPPISGNYVLQLVENSIVLDEKIFIVGQDPANTVSLTLDEYEYLMGDQVNIYLNNSVEGARLVILSNDNTYNFLGDVVRNIKFIPKSDGLHEVQVIKENKVMASAQFIVVSNLSKLDSLENNMSKIENKTESPAKIAPQVKLKNSNNKVSTRFMKILSTKGNKVDAELTFNDKHIRFYDLILTEDIELKIEDLPSQKINGKSSMKSFAIDPSNLDFSHGEISVTATGSELYKCKDWNFTQQICFGEWKFVRNLIPDQSYEILIDAADPAFAEVGVATINSKKPIYYLNETAELLIVVLDNKGHLANANLVLNITTPANITYTFTEEYIYRSSKGIYEAIFTDTSIEGEYYLSLSAIGDNVNQSMNSLFLAKSFFEFDIIRNTPITIDPWKGAIESSIRIVANNYSGQFNLVEKLPINFTVIEATNAVITLGQDFIYLEWSNLTNNSVVSYKAQAPLVTPDLYVAGPAYIEFGGREFYEARPWYLAVDPYSGAFFLFWDADSDQPDGWTCVSCNSSGDFYRRFIRGAPTYGGTRGRTTHSHTVTYVSETDSGAGVGSSGTSGVYAATPGAAGHSHGGLDSASSSTESQMPQYRQLKVIKYDGTDIPSTIPAGIIAIFNTTSLPSGWTRYAAQDGNFIFANTTANNTGGSNTHTHSVSIGLGDSSGSQQMRTGSPSTTVAADPHTHDTGAGTTLDGDIRPPYLDVILAKADSDTTIPYAQGFIAMFDSQVPYTWTNMSNSGQPFFENIIVGSATYGGIGGANNHSHANLGVTSGAPVGTETVRSPSNNAATNSHTHVVTVSFSNENNYPRYINVTFGYARIAPGVYWNQTSLSFGNVEVGTTSYLNAEITSYEDNDNVQVTCTGDCTEIQNNFTTTDMNDLDSIGIEFNCSSSNIGGYSADFSLNSSNSTIVNNIAVTCTVVDTIAPTWSNNVTDSLIYQGESVEFNVTWTDTVELDYAWFSTNLSGSWANYSYQSLTGMSDTATNISYINQRPGYVYGWMFYANDTSGNLNWTDMFSFTVLGVTWNESSLEFYNPVLGSTSYTYATINSFGSNDNVNVTCTGDCSVIEDNFNDGINMNDLESIVVEFNCTALVLGDYNANFSLRSDNDTIIEDISVRCNLGDTNPPYWFNNLINDSQIYQGETVQFSVTWNDTIALNYSWFSTNLSGIWINATPQALSGTSDTATNISYINQPAGYVVGWRFFANDTAGNLNWTDIFSFTILGVTWNQSVLNFGTVEGGSTYFNHISVLSYGSNNNVQTGCTGDCSVIQDNFTDGTSMGDLDLLSIDFNCSASQTGDYYSNFSVTSANDTIYDILITSCTVVDTTAPTIYLQSPINNSLLPAVYAVDFKFNVSDFSNITNCSLIVNDLWNKTSSQILKDTPGQIINQTFDVGDYIWSINCTDTSNNVGASSTYNLTVYREPKVTLTHPGIYYTDYNGNVPFNCTATDDYDIVNISLYTNISGGGLTLNQTIDYPGVNDTSVSAGFIINNIPNQTVFIWSCLVVDNETIPNTAWGVQNRTVYIDLNPDPIVTLHTPANASTESSETVYFNCSATDDEDIHTLALYSNRSGGFNVRDSVVFTGVNDLSVSYLFSDGPYLDEVGYIWNCKAIDNESTERFSVSDYSFAIELGEPNVTLISPAHEAISTSQDVSLTCNGVDDYDIVNISLYHNVNGSFILNETLIFTGLNDLDITAVFNLSPAYGTKFEWNCLVGDNSSNLRYAPSNWSLAVANLDHYYGNIAQGTWFYADNARYAPDGTTADTELDEERILSIDNITRVPYDGTLLATFLSLAWSASTDTSDDQLDLGYSLANYDSANLNLDGSGYSGATSAANYPTGSVANQTYEITGSLSTTDLPNIRLRIQGDRDPPDDDVIAYIDSIYLSILFDYYPTPSAITKSLSVIFPNSSVNFFTTWTDDYFLGCYIFSINLTGAFESTSCIDFGEGISSATANYTWQINATPGTKVQWLFYANDSRSQMNQTPIQSFVVADEDDAILPTISNEQVIPSINSSGTIFNISATITDNIQVDRAFAEITLPNQQAINYSMTNTDDFWYYLYVGDIGGNYSLRIIAFDSVNNTNYSATRPEFNVTSIIITDQRYYERGDSVSITGKGYSASSTATLNIFRSNSSVMSGYPINKTTNASGTFTNTFGIPGSLSERLDNFTIEGNDTSESDLKNCTEIIVVVKSDTSSKYDDNFPTGTSVTLELNDSDNLDTTLVSDTTQVYFNLRFQDLILDGYTLDSLILYVEHQDFDAGSDPIVVQYYDGGAYQTATCANIPFSASKTFGVCNLTTDISSLPDLNDIRLRLTDNNLGANALDFTTIDFVYLDIDFSITNTLAVDILVPTNIITTVDYTDAVNNNAYEGTDSTSPPPPASQLTGVEASSSDYTDIESSNEERWQSTATANNDHVYHSFYLYTTIAPSDIIDISVTWEGYITEDGSTAEDIRIYAWNYISGGYIDLAGAAVSGSTTDQTLTYSLPGDDSQFVDTDGEINVYVTSDGKILGGVVRQDIFTDYVKVDVTSLRTISGFQNINISAVDGDGVQSCLVNFINSSNYRYSDTYTTKIDTYEFHNRTYTLDYTDGVYNITANCTDGSEYSYDSVLVRINNVGPNVTLMYPPNNYLSLANDLNFTWNATQDSGTPVCDLYIDGVINISNINSNNGQNTTRQVNDISDGEHNWKVACKGPADIEGTSLIWNFTIDTTAPTISLDSPDESDFISIENITFLYTPSDFGTLNCSLYINDEFNATNLTVTSDLQTSFSVNNFDPGRYNWTVYCTDQFDYTGVSATNDYTIDLDNPRIILTFPEPEDVFLGGLVQFNYTVFDDIDPSLTCDLYVNGQVEFDDKASGNGTPVVQSKEMTSGTKYWNVTCVDDSGRQNTSVTWNFTINGDPTVVLVNPDNRSSLNQNNVIFVYNADDTDGIQNCSLYVNENYNLTNYTIFTGTENNFTLWDMGEGYYNWSVTCFDKTSKSSSTGLYYLTIDRTYPNITMLAPPGGSFFVVGDLSFNFTVTDNLDTSPNCTLYIDDNERTAANKDFEAANGSVQVRNETGIAGGSHQWDLACTDESGLTQLSESWDFEIGGLPSVTLYLPQNNSYSLGNVTFTYFAYDSDNLANCSLYINDIFNQTNTTPANNGNNTFNVSGIPEQTLNWTVYCTDTLNLTHLGGYFYLTIDNTPPVINLVYPNGHIVADEDVQFNFSVVENMPGSMTCEITLNGTVIDTFAGQNGTNLRTNNVSTDGTYFWNATCIDAAGLVAVSQQTYNLTKTSAPEVRLQAPPTNSVDTDGNISFQFQVNNNDINNCTLYINEGANQTINSSDINPFSTTEINATNLDLGIYNWTVGCINTNGIEANSSDGNWYFHVDFSPPNITLHTPINTENISLSLVNFNFTVYDDVDDFLLCNLTINGEVNETNISAQNGELNLIPVTGFSPGLYYWNVTCTDGAFFNTSDTYWFNVTGIPHIELVWPNTNYYDLDGNISFRYIPSTIDEDGFLACRLYIDDVLWQTNASLTSAENGIELRFFNHSIPEGGHNWSINCTDLSSQIGQSEYRNFIVDLTNPTIILNYPNGDFLNSSFSFNFTAIDNLDQTLNCNLTYNDTTITGISATNNTPYTHPVTDLSDDLYFWNVSCVDDSGRTNTSETYNFTVAEIPLVSLSSPLNNLRTRDTSFNFTYTPYDNSGLLYNCSLIINDQINITNYTINEGVLNNFSSYNFDEGTYNWTVECVDPAGNTGRNESGYNFTIDLTGPTIVLNYPDPDETFNYPNITFNYTAYDYDVLINCTLTVTDTFGLRTNYTQALSGSDQIITLVNLSDGDHYWNVTCVDDLNNSNTSETRYFIINQADLYINNSRVFFSNNNPDLGDNITIYANVSNFGGQPGYNVLVEFWDGLPGSGSFLGNDTRDVVINASVIFNVSWIINESYHNVWVIVDPNNVVDELSEDNNNASINLSVLWSNITSPLNNTWWNIDTLLFNFTTRDYFGYINYSIYVDGSYTGINDTVLDGTNSTINITFTEGQHTVFIRVNDSLNRIKDSPGITIIVDLTPPSTNFNTLNETWFNTSIVTINFTSIDNFDTVINYTVFVNGVIDITGSVNNNTHELVNLSALPNGTHTVVVEDLDEAGNRANSTTLTIYVDTVEPTISLLYPANGANLFTNFSDLNFTVYDNLDNVIECYMTLDSSLIANFDMINNTNNGTTQSDLSEGTHYWNVTCWDGNSVTPVNMQNTSETWSFNIFNIPEIILIQPDDNNWTNQENVTFFYNATDETGLENCSILIDGIISETNYSVTSGVISNITVNNLNGSYNWSIECYDNTSQNNYAITANRTIHVDLDAPYPNIETLNNTWFNYNTPLIAFNITDNMDTILNYSFFVNNTVNVQGSASKDISSNDNLNSLADGYYILELEARDEAMNRRNSSGIRIYVDTAPPSIVLNRPENANSTIDTNIFYNFTAYDNLANNFLCNLTVDNVVRDDFNATSGLPNTTTLAMSAGLHYWNVTCIDIAGNVNTSETWNFTIPLPDLTLNSTHIGFNTSLPQQFRNITINATIFNVGETDAENVIIQFFVGNLSMQIDSNITRNISAGANVTVNVSWYVSLVGDIDIYVVVDPPLATNGSIFEFNENNNFAYNTFTVGSYHIVYGNLTGLKNIQDLTNRTIFEWNISDYNGTLIFAVDSDSNIEWSKLHAISRDTSGSFVFNDFNDVDVELYLENNTDSVNSTWTQNNYTRLQRNYTIYFQPVNNVPIANSTNTSNFMTGILWDKSDGNTQYNGTQDIVFFTKVNVQQQGKLGIYDFELKIPANLRLYKGSDQVTVSLYTEIP